MGLPRPEWKVGAVALDLINMFIAHCCAAVFVKVAGLVLILLLMSGIVITSFFGPITSWKFASMCSRIFALL